MAQFDHGTINPATKSGTQLASDLNNRAAAENSTHAGTSRPAYAAAGLIWVNTSFSPPHATLWDGADDIDLTLLFAPSPGTIKETARILLEDGWLWCDGATHSRATYPDLFDAITAQTTGDTDGTAVIANVADDLTGLGLIGAVVEGAGVPAGAAIAAVGAATITLDQATTAAAAGVSLRILPHGAGNGSTTFNVPDRRGRVGAGRDDMGGSAANRLTTAGAGFDGKRLGAAGGAQTHTLTVAQLAAHGHSASSSGTTSTDGNHFHNSGSLQTTSDGGHRHDYDRYEEQIKVDVDAAENKSVWNKTSSTTTSFDGVHSHSVNGSTSTGGAHAHTLSLSTTVDNAGGGQAHPNVQPSLITNYTIKT